VSTANPPAAATTNAALPPLNPPVTLMLGHIQALSAAPWYIGIARGYYKAQGIDLLLQRCDSGSGTLAPLGAGQLQVAASSLSAGLFNALGRGVAIKIVADDGSYYEPNWGQNGMVGRKDLVDSGQVKSVTDLTGRKVAFSSPTTGPFTWDRILKGMTNGQMTTADYDSCLWAMPT
jgi:NitT/TauT family transport system substrate-binding protein